MSADRRAVAMRWMSYALGDLDAARFRPGHPMRPRIVAYNAQQAVEKALKAALIESGVEPPRTHDLDVLRNLLPSDWQARRRFPNLAALSEYAVEVRYPDNLIPVTPIQAATAVRQAIAVVRVIREDFARRGADVAALRPE